MSHYGVAVFSKTNDSLSFDELLEPYSESDKKYFTFHKKPHKEIEKDFEEFHKNNPSWDINMYIENFGYEKYNGEWGYWYNDNAKWDYYPLDARPSMEEALIREGEAPDDVYYRFRKSQIELRDDEHTPIAFITPDGEWHAAGTVGWFATCDDTPESWEKQRKDFKEFLAAPGDEYVSFVDCHI